MRHRLQVQPMKQIAVNECGKKRDANHHEHAGSKHSAIVGQEPLHTEKGNRPQPMHDTRQDTYLNATITQGRTGHTEKHPIETEPDRAYRDRPTR